MDTTIDFDVSLSTDLINLLPTEAVLCTPPAVVRILCGICFTGCNSKNAKRAGFEEIKNVKSSKDRAFLWSDYDHDYNSIFQKHDWPCVKKMYGHKSCKGKFFKETYMTNQTRKSKEIEMDIEISDNNNEAQTIGKEKEKISLCKSSRYDQLHHSSKEDFTCVICAQRKKDKHEKEIHVSTMTFRKADEEEHKAEKLTRRNTKQKSN